MTIFYALGVYTLKSKIDDVIKKSKSKILTIWNCQIVAQMIAVIFSNDILDVLINRLGFTSRPSWVTLPKNARDYFSETVITIDFRI